jgi:hypothetical protein
VWCIEFRDELRDLDQLCRRIGPNTQVCWLGLDGLLVAVWKGWVAPVAGAREANVRGYGSHSEPSGKACQR